MRPGYLAYNPTREASAILVAVHSRRQPFHLGLPSSRSQTGYAPIFTSLLPPQKRETAETGEALSIADFAALQDLSTHRRGTPTYPEHFWFRLQAPNPQEFQEHLKGVPEATAPPRNGPYGSLNNFSGHQL